MNESLSLARARVNLYGVGTKTDLRRVLGAIAGARALFLTLSVFGACDDDHTKPEAAGATAGVPASVGAGEAGAPTVVTTGGDAGSPPSLPSAGEGGVAGRGGDESGGGDEGEAGAAFLADTGCALDEPDPGRDDLGQLLFNVSEPCAADGRALFLLGDELYWHYQSASRWVLARGSTAGGAMEVLLSSAEPIDLVDVRGVLAYQVGQRLFALPPSSHEPIELEAAPGCATLSSTPDYVYCAASDGPLLRWPSTGGPSKVIASGIAPGFIADAVYRRFLLIDGWNVSYMPLSGVGASSAITFSLYSAVDAVRPGAEWKPVTLSLLHLSPDSSRVFWLEDSGDGLSNILSRAQALDQTSWQVEVEGLAHNAGFLPTDDGGLLLNTSLPDGSSYLAWAYGGVTTTGYYSARGVVGFAQDAHYAYWLDSSARIYRGRRPIPPPSPAP